jgi:glycosyltransferase involved in cell wall biosynthesis
MSISLIAYGFNEEENIKNFIFSAHKFCKSITKDFEIVYLDDGSTDDTLKIITRLKKINKYRIKIYKNKNNKGVGYNFKKILKLTKKKIIIHQTIDWSYNIYNFTPYLHLLKINKYDILHGYRYFDVKKRSDNFYRGVISIINKIVIGLLFGNFTRDFQNVYVIKKKCLKNINLLSKSSFVNPELLMEFLMKNFKIAEINIDFKKRRFGKAKGAKLRFLLRSIFDIILLWFIKGIRFRISNKNSITILD